MKLDETFTFKTLTDKVANGEHFYFVRYGDGEMQCITGHKGHNCDGHFYFSNLGQALKGSIMAMPQHDQYICGIQPKAIKDMPLDVEATFKHGRYINADIIHDASLKGNDFWNWYQSVHSGFLLVGPSRICPDLQIPVSNCWLQYDRMKSKVIDYIMAGNDKIFLCASMPAKVLAFELWIMFGPSITVIDLGSVLEPYFGHQIRNYHKQVLKRG